VQTEVDYIIVGQGLAGSILAFKLLKKGYKVLVFNDEEIISATSIAAGMFTPVSGKRLTESYLAPTLLYHLNQTYQEMEIWTGKKFLHHMPIQQSFSSIKDQNDFYGNRSDKINQYINSEPAMSSNIQAPFGGFEINQSGWLNTIDFLAGVKQKLIQANGYLPIQLNSNEINFESNKVTYQNYTCKAVVFCTGYQNLSNPFFNNVPIIPNKGDVFLIETDLLDKNKIYKRGAYAVGIGNQLFKAGSTYYWNNSAPFPTKEGYDELKAKTDVLFNGDYQIKEHLVGIRPTTQDRKPVLGKHNLLPVYMFNGLGTKGVMMAPYFSDMMVDFLLHDIQPSIEVSIDRFNDART